jgi:hypothetical protein
MRSFKKNQYFKKRKFNQDGDLTSKICNHCKEWKSCSEFIKDQSLMDGLSNNCYNCLNNRPIESQNFDSMTNKNGF